MVTKHLRLGRAYLMRIIIACFRVTMVHEMDLSVGELHPE